jgi:HYR domain-containing protein
VKAPVFKASKALLSGVLFFVIPMAAATLGFARDLTFEERVAAQEAIERVYYSHQIGATIPFEEAVPREVLESKVRTYLKQSAALATFWNTPVTGEMLREELERIARESLFPGRLREIYLALNNDSFLVQECFVRAGLVDSLSHHLFSRDRRIHSDALYQAQALREDLVARRISIFADPPARSLVSIPPEPARRPWEPGFSGPTDPAGEGAPSVRDSPPGAPAPDGPGSRGGRIGPLLEEDDAFITRVTLPRAGSSSRMALYSTSKVTWDDWWAENEGTFDEQGIEAVASASVNLVLPPGAGASPDSPEHSTTSTEDSWAPVSAFNAPTARHGHGAVWTGSYMVVWGGVNEYSAPGGLNSGGRYDPITNRWTPTALANAPSPLWKPSLVWTGQQMVAFQFYPAAKNAGRYDPTANAWLSMSMASAPANRFGHTVVWTGSRIIVWGGYASDGSGTLLQSGGMYDPSSDSWTSTSAIHAPEPRAYHVAVWAGTQMIVWGGSGVVSYLLTGGRYDPVADSWSGMETSAAPYPREEATAVWTGTRMIVWGGDYGLRYFPDAGGQYDPVADRWTQTSLAAPQGRTGNSAVWTGKEMVVWGGSRDQLNTHSLNTGGRYDPVADIWHLTPALNAPAAREEHSAVWTGDRMIVWGGVDYFTTIPPIPPFIHPVFDSGSLYQPPPPNHPPVADAGPDRPVECTSPAGALVALDGTRSSDPDSSPGTNDGITRFEWFENFSLTSQTLLGVGQNLTLWLPLGSHDVTLRVGDASGETATDRIVVNVSDTTPPALACPSAEPAECVSSAGTPVAIASAQVGDACDPHPVVASSHGSGGADASGVYPLGRTDVVMTASDAAGNQASCSFPVTVRDTTPPQVSFAMTPAVLWPPNHRMVDVGASVVATDACSEPGLALTSVTSSEFDDSPGVADGNTSGDIAGAEIGTADFDFQLRAERNGTGEGRTYLVTYGAVDASGNSSSSSSIVFVPHDQGGESEPVLITAGEGAAGTLLQWDPVAGASSYKMIRGLVGSLHESGDFIDLGTVSCVQADSLSGSSTTPGREDTDIPPLGQVFFYLASYDDGSDSGYGSDTAAKPRVKTGGGCE